MTLSNAQIQQFKIDGYLVLKNILSIDKCTQLQELVVRHLSKRIEPFELEAKVQYPGAPQSTTAAGGETIRRLLMAYQRDPQLSNIATLPAIIEAIQQILDAKALYLNPNHHNCVMTKMPAYSSKTLWHRDTRYWSFNNKYLINAWFALGDEHEDNGSLKILPGSHRWDVSIEDLDEAQFLKPGHSGNFNRLATQRSVNLNTGDALLFSANCFHAAGKNITENPKISAVFTYHGRETRPIVDSHSANLPEIQVL